MRSYSNLLVFALALLIACTFHPAQAQRAAVSMGSKLSKKQSSSSNSIITNRQGRNADDGKSSRLHWRSFISRRQNPPADEEEEGDDYRQDYTKAGLAAVATIVAILVGAAARTAQTKAKSPPLWEDGAFVSALVLDLEFL